MSDVPAAALWATLCLLLSAIRRFVLAAVGVFRRDSHTAQSRTVGTDSRGLEILGGPVRSSRTLLLMIAGIFPVSYHAWINNTLLWIAARVRLRIAVGTIFNRQCPDESAPLRRLADRKSDAARPGRNRSTAHSCQAVPIGLADTVSTARRHPSQRHGRNGVGAVLDLHAV